MSCSVLQTESSEDDVFKCAACSSTLRDPVLLQCLHSVCRSCTTKTNANVTCVVCQVTTDTSTIKTNNLVSSLEHRSLVLKNIFSCKHCIEDANEDATVVAWCSVCQQPLCVDLLKCHKILLPSHKVMEVNESTHLSELYRPPVRYCTKHGEELKLACFTCQDCRCYMCVQEFCYTSSHEVLPLDGPETVKRINDRLADLTRMHWDLKSTAGPLQSYLKLPETVANARKASQNMLQNAKKTAIESINRAYTNAESCLLTCWDTLLSNSLCLRESFGRLQARLDWASKYCQLALTSNDVAGVFPQLEAIISSLNSLLAEVSLVKEPTDPLKMVSLSIGLPCDLDLITDDWLGLAKVVSEDFSSSVCDVPAGDISHYYTRKVSTLKELEHHLYDWKEEQKRHQCVQQSLEQLQSEMKLKHQQLINTENEMKKLRGRQKMQQEQLDRERRTVGQLQWQLRSITQQLMATQYEVRKLLDQQREHERLLEGNQRTVDLLQSELRSKTQELVATQYEVTKLREQQREHQLQLEGNQRTVYLLQSEQRSKTQQLAAPTKPLSFDSKPRGTFTGPGCCFDVAVTPQGRLLVAALGHGLKEYDAVSFREIATWNPDAALLGQKMGYSVRTVDVLSDGRVVVGLNPKLIVLLRRDVVSSSSSGRGTCGRAAAAEGWLVERRVTEVQGVPRHLSAWGDRLLAVLEDRYNASTESWCCGPGLVLLSLSDGDKQLHRQQLEYNAVSVALTDRSVIVASEDPVELSVAVGEGRVNRRCYVVDCYSHLGMRLWRHVIDGGAKVMSVCSDTIGRVIYAAKCRGAVVALGIDDGRELSTAVELSRAENQTSFAIALDKATQRRLVLITWVEHQPNVISIFSIA